MNNKIDCSSKLSIPYSASGLESIYDDNLVDVYPEIKHKIYVSFDTSDCKKMNMNVYSGSQLETLLNAVNSEAPIISKLYDYMLSLFKAKLTIDEKKKIILEQGEKYTLNQYFSKLGSKNVDYFKNLFISIENSVNLKFEIVENNLYERNTSDYKISICEVESNALRNLAKQEARTFFPIGKKPDHCLIVVDSASNEAEKFMGDVGQSYVKHLYGHELLHCLGLNHPSYKSLQENKAHRSIMEDITPITKYCEKKDFYGKDFYECMNLPSMPTDDDICALKDLYGDLEPLGFIAQVVPHHAEF